MAVAACHAFFAETATAFCNHYLASHSLVLFKTFNWTDINLSIGRINTYNWTMTSAPNYPRYAKQRLVEALADNPAVLLHGPRQCGKTTLARQVGREAGYEYFSFDDANLLAAAKADPMGFVADLPAKTVLDEIQRAPDLFAPLKALIDADRKPGRILLTGSANILLAPKLSDSLAGRMEIIRLHPLARCEIVGTDPKFLDKLFSGRFKLEKHTRLGSKLLELVIAGGYPPALARKEPRRRREWYRNYLEALVQRDARDLARIQSLEILPKLLTLAAGQTARLMNISDLSAPFQLSRPTIREYATLLERLFLLETLTPWHNNRMSRLIKTPKLHMGDSGLAAGMLGINAETLKQDRNLLGQLLETFVFQELRRHASWHDEAFTFHHFRDKDQDEVDVVIEKGGSLLAGVEVKASATVTSADFRGLRKLRSGSGTSKRFTAGVVLYDGETTVRFEDSMYAVPVSALWGG